MSIKKIQLFLKISKYNSTTEKSEIVDLECKDSKELTTGGNGGAWCRFDGTFGKTYKVVSVNNSRKIRFSWDVTEVEKSDIETVINNDILIRLTGIGNKIRFLWIVGKQNKKFSRHIRTDIRKELEKNSCSLCGSLSDIEIDHKNGLYNDPRVADIKTQTIEDFQALCRHCNLVKRQVIKNMKETGIRPKARDHPMFKHLNIDYLYGNESYDPNDPNALVGTLWYDFVFFNKKAHSISLSS